MTVLIFANPYSGNKENPALVARLEEALQKQGREPRIVWERDGRVELIRELPDDSTVVAAGGDGSIADVVNDMHAAGRLALPFATLPVGTENLFAQEFGYDVKKPETIAAAVTRGRTRAVDLGRVAPETADDAEPAPPRLFTLMASAGFDAEVVRRLSLWRTAPEDGTLRRVKRLSYFKPVLASIFGYRYPQITLTADGRSVTGTQAYVFNLPRYGGGLGIGRHADAFDGQLHWLVFRRPGLVRLLGYHALCVLGRQCKSNAILHGHARSVTFAPANGQALPVQADGDPAGDTPLRFEVMPGALNVVEL